MDYKIGDKIRITSNAAWSGLVGEICIVYELHPLHSSFPVRAKHLPSNWECLMHAEEIEKLPNKGTQLLFAFMDEVV